MQLTGNSNVAGLAKLAEGIWRGRLAAIRRSRSPRELKDAWPARAPMLCMAKALLEAASRPADWGCGSSGAAGLKPALAP